MAFSLGLALYQLTGRREQRRGMTPAPRPAGRLVWLHAPGSDSRPALQVLAQRLIEEDGVPVLMTSNHPFDETAGLLQDAPPEDRAEAVAAFLDHWRPEVVLMAEGELRPVLLQALGQRRIPVLLADGIAPRLVEGRGGWFPGLRAHALRQFTRTYLRDDTAAKEFRRAGLTEDRLQVTGPMEEASAALPGNESDRTALAARFAARPVWLAMDVPEAEEATVIAAHREALRLAHRLLLILCPEDPARGPALAAELEAAEGWKVARRALDEEPDAETEVFVVDPGPERGLWYRLAPVVYLGGGLSDRGCLRNPMEAAALGSALILGPKDGIWGRAYARLAAGNAMRMVASAGDLNLAVNDLLSPDRAARLAQAAWVIASDGSEVTALVLDTLRNMMDGVALPALALTRAPT